MRLRELMRIRELYEINDIRFTIYENYMRILRIIYDLRITIHENVVIKIDSFRKFFAENKKAQKKHAYKHADKYTSKKIKIKQTALNRASRHLPPPPSQSPRPPYRGGPRSPADARRSLGAPPRNGIRGQRSPAPAPPVLPPIPPSWAHTGSPRAGESRGERRNAGPADSPPRRRSRSLRD